MKRIIIRLDHQSPAETDWAEVNAQGEFFSAKNSLAEISTRINEHRILVLLPGSEVLITRVTLPGGNRKRQVQAVPYILEESLAADVEELHFALGNRLEDNTCAVAVIAGERLDRWLDLLADAGIEPDFMGSEVLAVPFSGTPAILFDGRMIIFRTGSQSGFAFESAGLEELQTGDSELFAEITLYGPGKKNDLPADIEHKITSEKSTNAEPLEILASGLSENNSINLLQGDYSPHAQWEKLWHRWRLPVALILAALLLFSGLQMEKYFTLRQKNLILSQQIEQLYKEVFPEAQKIVNPRAQMEHNLRQLRKETGVAGGFLPLLKRTASHLSETEGFKLDGLHFHDGSLDLDIRLANLYALDDLKNKLSSQGLIVNIRTASSIEDEVQARLKIREKSS